MKVWIVYGLSESDDECCDYNMGVDSVWSNEEKAKERAANIWGGETAEWTVQE